MKSPVEITESRVESALLVGVRLPQTPLTEVVQHLDELEQLTKTMGLSVKGREIVNLRGANPKYLVGSGKAEELSLFAGELDVDCIIFDDDLGPSQQRNWETLSNKCVIDRQEVILDIFADRAETREAVLQVGLARMVYSLPRLTRAWTHLSRQRGGSKGTRGEGETQLEVDRRIVLTKISRMKRELEQVQKQRATRRKRRESVPMPTAAIVGYTNAGKSSLLNVLTGSDAMVENKLFATLDPTTRRLPLNNGTEILLTDTVGFIRKLPHGLVEAFKSTLEETVLSDYLIHVLDGSNQEVAHHHATTMAVLREIGAGDKPIITILNKIDLLKNRQSREDLRVLFPNSYLISIKQKIGLEHVVSAIKKSVFDSVPVLEFFLPKTRYDLQALIHRTGRVLEEKFLADGIQISAQVTEKTRGLCAEYVRTSDSVLSCSSS